MIQPSQLTPVNLVYAMHAYYMQGNSMIKVAKRFGKSTNCIHKAFKRHGLYIRSKSHAEYLHHNIDAEIRAMYADYLTGLSHAAVGRKYQYTASAVRYRFLSRRLPSRPATREAT